MTYKQGSKLSFDEQGNIKLSFKQISIYTLVSLGIYSGLYLLIQFLN